MQKLIDELTRLYLPPGAPAAVALRRQFEGHAPDPTLMAPAGSLVRAAVIDFRKIKQGAEAQHWNALCLVANALQTELGLPAPAVSISGVDGYRLWLSLETPTPPALVRQFLELLRERYFPDIVLRTEAPELPPCLHADSGKWAAFIHPDLGASFADESGLEMAPPLAGQAALLEGLHSVGEAQLLGAIAALRPSGAAAAAAPAAAPPSSTSASAGLLLKDATLEDIVRHLHAQHIEPTFRHLIGRPVRTEE